MHDYQKNKYGNEQVKQLAEHLREWEKHGGYIYWFKKPCRAYYIPYWLPCNIWKEKPEHQAWSSIKNKMRNISNLAEDDNQYH